MRENLVLDKSFDFSVEVVYAIREMRRNGVEIELTSQLLRSGTSICANITEAQGAQSEKDFLSKMTIALKEARETLMWIRLLKSTHSIPADMAEKLMAKADELVAILTSIAKSMRDRIRETNTK